MVVYNYSQCVCNPPPPKNPFMAHFLKYATNFARKGLLFTEQQIFGDQKIALYSTDALARKVRVLCALQPELNFVFVP